VCFILGLIFIGVLSMTSSSCFCVSVSVVVFCLCLRQFCVCVRLNVFIHNFCQYSYGGEEEEEENMDDSEAAIDAPEVSGCAGWSSCSPSFIVLYCMSSRFFFYFVLGEEEVPMGHPDDESS